MFSKKSLNKSLPMPIEGFEPSLKSEKSEFSNLNIESEGDISENFNALEAHEGRLSLLQLSVHIDPKAAKEKFKFKLGEMNEIAFLANNIVNEEAAKMVSIKEKTNFDMLEEYTDTYPFIEFRKACMLIFIFFRYCCTQIVTNSLFECIMVVIILSNTVLIAIENTSSFNSNISEAFFLYIYTLEFGLKIAGLGVISKPNSYFRDLWNVLDFAILIFGWLSFTNSGTLNLYVIRSIRILRTFRSISSVEGLRVIFISLCGSLVKLSSSLVLLSIFCLILAVAGVQIFMSQWTHRCMDLSTGYITDLFCGSDKCESGYICVDSLDNPNYGNSNFDNTAYALLTVFQCITLEGWSDLLKISVSTSGSLSVIFFIIVTFVGAFVLINLALAIIKASFTETMNKTKGRIQENDIEKSILKKNNNAVNNGFVEENKTMNFLNQAKKAQEIFNIGLSEPSENDEFRMAKNEKKTQMRKNSKDVGNIVENRRVSVLKGDFQLLNTIHLKHDFLQKFRLGKFNKKYKVVIDTEEKIVSETVSDMQEPLSKAEILTQFKYTGYSFMYGGDANSEFETEQVSRQQSVETKYNSDLFRIFKVFSRWRSKKIAFFMVMEQVSSHIRLQENDFRLNQHVIGGWSGTEINEFNDVKIDNFNFSSYRCWDAGLLGVYQKILYPIKILVNSKFFTKLMTFFVLLNTIILSIDHYGLSTEGRSLLNLFNFILTIIFSAEVFLKIIANGPVSFARDKLNLYDLCIVILSILELIFLSPSGSKFSALRVVRVFRLFRVLRVARMFRYFQSLIRILKAIGKSISKIMYLFLLLLIFIVIFSLVGVQVFSGNFQFADGLPRSNFDGFDDAFFTIMQILSLENWQEVLYNAMRSNAGAFSCFFLIAWIIIGNFILLNLFLAIMLDSFTEDSESIIKNERKFRVRQSVVEDVESSLESEIDYKSESKREKEDIFKDIPCEKSFWLFSKQNGIRRFAYFVTNSSKFDQSIGILIILSTIKLIWDTYIIDYPMSSTEQRISFAFDVVFNVLFLFELVLKAIKLGFCMDQESYLRDLWNKIDFFIVVVSFIDIAVSDADISYIKFIRLLRTLRPLRLLSHNFSMKIIVTAMFESVLAIFNVFIVMAFIILIFAIMGVSLFGGMLYSCNNELIEEKSECLKQGFSWENSDVNFDNVLEAIATLFILTTQEGWPDIMHKGMDVVDTEHSPRRDNFKYGAFYFIFYILIGSFFFLNLFMAVIFQKFTEVKLRESSLIGQGLTKDQQIWVELQNLAVESKFNHELSKPPANCIRKAAYWIVTKDQFEYCISFFIFFNFVVISMNYKGASREYDLVLDYISIILNSVFIAEAVLKITGLGFRNYFKSRWNKFDFATVVISVAGMIVENLNEINDGTMTDVSKLIRLIRVVRIFRLLRVIKFLAMISETLSIISYSLPAILNVLSLMSLIFLIYSVLGVLLFRDVTTGSRINPLYNFSSFHKAFLLLYRIVSGEDWHLILFDCSKSVGKGISYTYFYSFITLNNLLLLNLFIMVILQNYEDFESKAHSAINLFNEIIKVFRKAWENYSISHNGYAIQHTDLVEFLYELGPNYGFPRYVQKDAIIRKMAALNLNIDPSGYICYNDLLYVVIKRLYKTRIQGNSQNRSMIDKSENKAQKSLKKLQESALKKLNNNKIVKSASNIFYTHIKLRSILKAWSRLASKKSVVQNLYSEAEYPGEISFRSEASLDFTNLKQ